VRADPASPDQQTPLDQVPERLPDGGSGHPEPLGQPDLVADLRTRLVAPVRIAPSICAASC
jgi:hypothetical protein